MCKKKIEYNKYKVIDGKIYCPDCVPKTSFEKAAPKGMTLDEAIESTKADTEKLGEALVEAEEQFEKEMADVGNLTEPEDKEKPKKKRGRKKDENL